MDSWTIEKQRDGQGTRDAKMSDSWKQREHAVMLAPGTVAGSIQGVYPLRLSWHCHREKA
jgi:hypothetical protein